MGTRASKSKATVCANSHGDKEKNDMSITINAWKPETTETITNYNRPARSADYGFAVDNDSADCKKYAAFVRCVLPNGDLIVDLHGAGRGRQMDPKGFTIDPTAYWNGFDPDAPEYMSGLSEVLREMPDPNWDEQEIHPGDEPYVLGCPTEKYNEIDRFGLCPVCHQPGVHFNMIEEGEWFTCAKDLTAWNVTGNLFTPASPEDSAIMAQKLEEYTAVKPYYTAHTLDVGAAARTDAGRTEQNEHTTLAVVLRAAGGSEEGR
jgi:hypothetical protein